jgi:hypothetical protein
MRGLIGQPSRGGFGVASGTAGLGLKVAQRFRIGLAGMGESV